MNEVALEYRLPRLAPWRQAFQGVSFWLWVPAIATASVALFGFCVMIGLGSGILYWYRDGQITGEVILDLLCTSAPSAAVAAYLGFRWWRTTRRWPALLVMLGSISFFPLVHLAGLLRLIYVYRWVP